MSSTAIIITSVSILVVGTINYFNKQKNFSEYKKMKNNWLRLAKELNLETNIEDGENAEIWKKGFEASIKGVYNGFPLEIRLPLHGIKLEPQLSINLYIRNPKDISFSLSYQNPDNNLQWLTSPNEFDKWYYLAFSPLKFKEVIFDNTIQKEVILVFTKNMTGRLRLSAEDEITNMTSVLDSEKIDQLVYTNSSLRLIKDWEYNSVKRKIDFMVMLAQKIENIPS